MTLTPKEQLSRDIVALLAKFRDDTGVFISGISIGYFEVSEPEGISKTYVITSVNMSMAD